MDITFGDLVLPYVFWNIVVIFFQTFGVRFIIPDIKKIYEDTNMNLFGCILSSIAIFILNPIVSICWIVYWICHIGRKMI